MFRNPVWKASLVAVGVALASSAVAQGSGSDDSPHFYGGGSVGRSEHSELVWGLLGGFQANRWLGAELGYRDLGRQTIGGVTVDGTAWELVGVGRVPLFDKFAAIGKLGGYMGRTKGSGVSENNTDLTYGLGLEYGFTRNLALRGEWQRYSELGGGSLNAKSDLDVATLSVLYRFR